MNRWMIGTACAVAMLMAGTAHAQTSSRRATAQQKSTAHTSQAARNRTERVTVDGCLIRGSEYTEVPHLSGYVLRDVQTVEPQQTASLSGNTRATYGTYAGGKPTASASVSGNDHLSTTPTEAIEQKGAIGSPTENIGVSGTPSTDAQGSTPGAGAIAKVERGGSTSATGTATGTTGTSAGMTAYALEGVTKPTTYIGKRVEIVGTMMTAPSASSANRMSRLRVTSVKLIPGSCR